MSAGESWILVDDRDSGIGIQPIPTSYMLGGTSEEYCQTTTGLLTGDSLIYSFNASAIGVYGTYSPTTDLGPPVAVYQVDSLPAATVTAPITQRTQYLQNFWNITNLPPLQPGLFHTLNVTSISPNLTVWVDYLAYPPASLASSTTSSAPTSSIPSSTHSSATSTENAPTPTSGTSSASGSGSSSNSSSSIAGIVVGVVTFLLAVAALVIYLRRQRSQRHVPFSTGLLNGEFSPAPEMSESTHVDPFPPSAPSYTTYDRPSPSYTSVPQQLYTPDEFVRPLPRAPIRTVDGGVSLSGGPLQIPPEYQEHYT